MSSKDYVKGGMLTAPLRIGLGRYKSVNECELYLADTQERLLNGRSHYYLWGLAVDPSRQRTGAGTALLEAFLKKTDEDKLPVYLETHKETNVSYYEKRGFKLIGTEKIPKYNLDFWCLLHEPSDIR
jgi:ribosomal protein S18 acetylase RimI-like enzyme